MVCKHCQKPIKSDFKFCPYCGERTVSDFQDHYEGLTPPPVMDEGEPNPSDYYTFHTREPQSEVEIFQNFADQKKWNASSRQRDQERQESDGELPYYVFRPEELPDLEPENMPEEASEAGPKNLPLAPTKVGWGRKFFVALLSIALGVGIATFCYWLAFGNIEFRPSDLSALFVRLWW